MVIIEYSYIYDSLTIHSNEDSPVLFIQRISQVIPNESDGTENATHNTFAQVDIICFLI
jgi:hypothetical protein